ncbi:ragulator complex protein LAMTOR4 isoform X1 [Takifugu flavidus]|uniref:ragulator complex protein LAMTOR4 isoform X1 n=1 Tax=Takifugu flavidus TaxID=433684 RepID=UPI0025444EB7|nr:ragulator complex protein LAMTOR4 isoform X1 [Takifugu flavidus]
MTTAVLTSGLERIPDQLGYLVISEDGVLAVSVQIMFVYRIRLPSSSGPAATCARPQSAGELENDENTAAVMMQMVRTASRFRLPGSADPSFKRMSVVLEDFVYVVTVSAQKVFVVKRQNNQHEPIGV